MCTPGHSHSHFTLIGIAKPVSAHASFFVVFFRDCDLSSEALPQAVVSYPSICKSTYYDCDQHVLLFIQGLTEGVLGAFVVIVVTRVRAGIHTAGALDIPGIPQLRLFI